MNKITMELIIETIDDLKKITKRIRTLIFGFSFNQPIENLDLKNVETLAFGYNFNQPIEKLDLKNVHKLTFGKMFNKPMCNTKHVKHFTFGDNFNKNFTSNIIGNHLTHITFGFKFCQSIIDVDLKNVDQNKKIFDFFILPIFNDKIHK